MSFKYTPDGFGYLEADQPLYIRNWDVAMELWIDMEFSGQVHPSAHQSRALAQFNPGSLQDQLQHYCEQLIAEKRIVKDSRRFELVFKVVIIPRQDKTDDLYVLVYADTSWRKWRKKYIIELEILFKNNEIALLQEMTGIASRLEWDHYFNTKEKRNYHEDYDDN